MALILAIQPDERQAAILSGVVMNQLRADLVLVDSKEAALARIRKRVPDLILLAAELGRPDDEEFAARLRKIKDAEQLRVLSMPSLGYSEEDEEPSGGGLLRAFKRKRDETRRRGRDPKLFAKELLSCLKRAERIKADRLSEIATAPTPAEEATPAPSVQPTPPPSVAPTATPNVEPPMAPAAAAPAASKNRPAPPAAPRPVTTLDAIERRVAMTMRAIDTDDAGAPGDADLIIRALRVPPRVAGVAYPRGCCIGHIRLARPPRQRVPRRPAMEPPPSGVTTRYQAAF